MHVLPCSAPLPPWALAKDMGLIAGREGTVLETGFHEQGRPVKVPHAAQGTERMSVSKGDPECGASHTLQMCGTEWSGPSCAHCVHLPCQGIRVPVKCLSHAGEAAKGQQDQHSLGLLVDLRRAEVVNPALQDVGTLLRAEPDLQVGTW